jgi:hypothetical protein
MSIQLSLQFLVSKSKVLFHPDPGVGVAAFVIYATTLLIEQPAPKLNPWN